MIHTARPIDGLFVCTTCNTVDLSEDEPRPQTQKVTVVDQASGVLVVEERETVLLSEVIAESRARSGVDTSVSLVTTPATEKLVWKKAATGAVTKRGGTDEKNINFDKAVDALVAHGSLECKAKNRIPLRYTLTDAGQKHIEEHFPEFIPDPMSPVPPVCTRANSGL
ncbi:unnamed protein product, partial [marine sediment metagenome]